MVKRLLRPIPGWETAESLVLRVAGKFTTWPAGGFEGFPTGFAGAGIAGMAGAMVVIPPPVEPPRPPALVSTPPASVEARFMRLHAEGRLDEMWEMVAEDAQRAWGGRDTFVREMPRLDEWMEILDLEVVAVKILESWTDHVHQRTYGNVAELVMRYRVKQQWREWTFDRQVHLVPAAGGWRTLCYPMRVRTAASR